MSRILVTGADGFIGRAVCAALAEKGHHVIAGTRSGETVAGASENRRLGDMTHPEGTDGWVSKTDMAIHLAARVHVRSDTSLASLGAFRRVNVDGTRALAEAAARRGVRRLILLSSVKVNGDATADRPFTEADLPDPQDAYGTSKWEAEQLLEDVGARNPLETVILRVPLVYGPGVKGNFLSLLKLCDSSLPLPLGGLTGNRRSLLYTGNLTNAISVALQHPKAAGRTFLVSDGAPVSTAALVQTLRAALDRPPRLFTLSPGLLRLALSVIGKSTAADRLTRSLEINSSEIAETLGWQAPFTLQAGMAATAAWYRASSKKGE